MRNWDAAPMIAMKFEEAESNEECEKLTLARGCSLPSKHGA